MRERRVPACLVALVGLGVCLLVLLGVANHAVDVLLGEPPLPSAGALPTQTRPESQAARTNPAHRRAAAQCVSMPGAAT